MKKICVNVILTIMILGLFVTGCGSSNKSSSASAESKRYAAEEAAYDYDYAYDNAGYAAEEVLADTTAESGSGSSSVEVQDTSRKLIKNVDMSVETDNLDGLLNDINERINGLGGYIEYSYIDNGSSSYSSRRSSNLTIRIPAKNLDAFINNVTEVSNVVTKNVNVTDVTLQYVDVEAKRDSLNTQQQRLLELMEQAETVEEIIYIEDRLAQIRYELESAERQLRSFDNQVDYSTVTMNISEVKEYTPIEEPTRWEYMTKGFVDSVKGVFNGILDFFAELVVALPYLILWAIIIVIIVLIVRAIIRSNKKKAVKKTEIKQEELKKQQEEIKRRYAMEQEKAKASSDEVTKDNGKN